MILFVFMNLWSYMYTDSTNRISGYTVQQMIWYVILTEIIWFGGRNKTLMSQMSNDIKSGTIAYGINKPYHYIFYVIAKHLGEITIKAFLYLGAGIVIGLSFVGRIPNFRMYQLPIIAISFFFGIMISSFISMGISIFSFWIEDSTPFHWIYDKMILVIGTLFPVEIFPAWAQPIIKCSPIYVVNYGPAKLTIDFSYAMAGRVLLIQGIYFIVTLLLLFTFFQRGVKKLNVNGG
jgi:ABC-2 type transport system permease protein